MADHSRKRTEDKDADEQVHTPGGMTDPHGTPSPNDAADIAATDMDPSPSGDSEPPPAVPKVAQEEASAELHTLPTDPHTLPAEPDASRAQRLADEVEQWRDRHLRTSAEFDNFRKRVARERAELGDRAQAGLAARLLDVLDDMERLVSDRSDITVPALREALGLIDRKLRKELEGAGLVRLDPTGLPFDPQEHEAVSTAPAEDAERENHVSATFQPGYRFKGVLVRPARVQVFAEQGQA